ncbi:hypothetical protein VNO78_00716 [Psophocarpus tetragonolobus]|uniref:Uncharacterized protein n=1 Tax=Psophocarpus tetragonolobus TaxID=3891 RepID=A0AAN9XUU4_PSOTE
MYSKCAILIYDYDSDAFSYHASLCSSPSSPGASRPLPQHTFSFIYCQQCFPGLTPRTFACILTPDSATSAPPISPRSDPWELQGVFYRERVSVCVCVVVGEREREKVQKTNQIG